MTYFLLQITFVTSIAFIAGAIIGWWLHHYYNKKPTSDNDLGLIKSYLAESIKENALLKLQLKNAESSINKLRNSDRLNTLKENDFDAFKAFEDTLKEAQMRKYLN